MSKILQIVLRLSIVLRCYSSSKYSYKNYLIIVLALFVVSITGCSSSSSDSSSSSSGNSLVGVWVLCAEGEDEDTEFIFEFENDGDYFSSFITYSTNNGTCGGGYQRKDLMSYKYSVNSSNSAFVIDEFTDWQVELSDDGITNNNNLCGLNDWQGGYAKNSEALNASFSSTRTRYLFAIPELPDDGDTEEELIDAGDFDSGLIPNLVSYYIDGYYCSALQDIDHNEEMAFTVSGDSLTISAPEGTTLPFYRQ